MLQRTLPAGFIAPCLPTKTDKLPSKRCGSFDLVDLEPHTGRLNCRSSPRKSALARKSSNPQSLPLLQRRCRRRRGRGMRIGEPQRPERVNYARAAIVVALPGLEPVGSAGNETASGVA